MTTDPASGWRSDLREDLKQRALARAILADDAHDIALLDLEVDILERPDEIGICMLGAVIDLSDLQIRIFLAADGGPPAVQVL